MSEGLGKELESGTGVAVEDELKKPSLFKVVLHNDDYTTMEFVVRVLTSVFRKSHDEAVEIMMAVHQEGRGVCGVYPHELAEFRVERTTRLARESGFPLLCTMEEE